MEVMEALWPKVMEIGGSDAAEVAEEDFDRGLLR